MPEPEIIQQLREAVTEHSYLEFGDKDDPILIDVQTANAIVSVYDALSDKNKEKYCKYPIETMGFMAWELISRQRKAS